MEEVVIEGVATVHSARMRSGLITVLLFGSGMCALIYETVWLREFRLIFGGSTAASAAVLAIFMGGLGVGGIVLGKRIDKKEHPLRFYAYLEFLIAIAAAASPILLALVRAAYLWLGGSATLGSGLATFLRLVLSACVIGPATFLMGGTAMVSNDSARIDRRRPRRRRRRP